ncbi:hypothetical protein C9J12_25980 [Photobacterium frigidiphilum]|uniref:Uncharacterized protein n=1 Tax=Photobacterium frigidiphilum TaxID=264736 RepID=A0A2T3J7N5_9GAMM|nr:hypothetical protein [Photobacterium frigidiphilum]PSU44748.1 hypothetical protein C9J12_25980 [Photobacterium frigidiphilum]
MENEILQDQLIHVKANYWILTILSGIFLSLLLFMVTKGHFNYLTLAYGIIFGGVGYCSLIVSKHVDKIKRKITNL